MSDSLPQVIVAPPVKHKGGRPPIIIARPEVKDEILAHVANGAYMQTAFRAAGVSDANYEHWEEQANNGRWEFVEFFAALKKAEAVAELQAMQKMRDEPKFFVGNATYLERRFRDRWGRSDKHQIQADVNIRVEVVDYARLAKEIRVKKSK